MEGKDEKIFLRSLFFCVPFETMDMMISATSSLHLPIYALRATLCCSTSFAEIKSTLHPLFRAINLICFRLSLTWYPGNEEREWDGWGSQS